MLLKILLRELMDVQTEIQKQYLWVTLEECWNFEDFTF